MASICTIFGVTSNESGSFRIGTTKARLHAFFSCHHLNPRQHKEAAKAAAEAEMEDRGVEDRKIREGVVGQQCIFFLVLFSSRS